MTRFRCEWHGPELLSAAGGAIVGNQYEVTRARDRWLCAGLSEWRVTAEDPAVETLGAWLAISFWPIVTDFSSASSLWNNHTEVPIGSL